MRYSGRGALKILARISEYYNIDKMNDFMKFVDTYICEEQEKIYSRFELKRCNLNELEDKYEEQQCTELENMRSDYDLFKTSIYYGSFLSTYSYFEENLFHKFFRVYKVSGIIDNKFILDEILKLQEYEREKFIEVNKKKTNFKKSKTLTILYLLGKKYNAGVIESLIFEMELYIKIRNKIIHCNGYINHDDKFKKAIRDSKIKGIYFDEIGKIQINKEFMAQFIGIVNDIYLI